MEAQIKAIEATYNGYKFRSRLEARVAVLFDRMGVTWHYEYEGYQCPSGYYVPDFWLPDSYLRESKGILLEVKPSNHDHVHTQLEHVATELNVGALLLCGFELNDQDALNLYQIAPPWDCDMRPYHCLNCHSTLFSYCCGSYYKSCPHCHHEESVARNFDVFRIAYEYAIRYRFW